MKQFTQILMILGLIFFGFTISLAQLRPRFQLQQNLDNIDDVTTQKDLNVYLVTSNDRYMIIDQVSKIQLGSVLLDYRKTSLPGDGRTLLLDNEHFLLSTGSDLLKINVIDSSIDTVLSVPFPEFIVNFTVSPFQNNYLLIATKTYTPDKSGIVYFIEPSKKKALYDNTHNCRLLTFNLESEQVDASALIPYEVTAFAPKGTSDELWLGTFAGDAIAIGKDLRATTQFKASEFPIHSVYAVGSKVAFVPHQAPRFIGEYGLGKIGVYDKLKAATVTLSLPEETPKDKGSMLVPSNNIKRILPLHDQTILINYGHSRLMKLDLTTLLSSEYDVKSNYASFLCLNKDQTHALAIISTKMGPVAAYGSLTSFDLNGGFFSSNFRQSAARISYTGGLHKLKDRNGNYHYIGKTKDSYPDTLYIFSSNKTNRTILAISGQGLLIENDTSLMIYSSRMLVIGKLRLENLKKDVYNLVLPSYDNRYQMNFDSLIFQPYKVYDFEVRQKIPFNILAVFKTSRGFLIEGSDYHNKKTESRIVMVDETGAIVDRINASDYLHERPKLSARQTFIAISYSEGKYTKLVVWNLTTSQIAFKKAFPGIMTHFSFDRTEDLLFVSHVDPNGQMRLEQVDLREGKHEEKTMNFSNPISSFAVDVSRDLIATDDYESLNLFRLSNQQLIWTFTPTQAPSRFEVDLAPNGFIYKSPEEFHSIAFDLSHLYFSTFARHLSLEVLNGSLYRADRSLLNSFAFTYKGKGYFPGDYDFYFNRPDSVVLKSGSTNTLYNSIIGSAVRKRQRQMRLISIDSVLQEAPSVTISNRSEIPDATNTPKLSLDIRANATGAGQLEAIHIYVNGVPIYGQDGLYLKYPRIQLDTTFHITLSSGTNTIQVVAQSTKKIKSASEVVRVNYVNANPQERLHFIGVGVDQYLEPGHDLRYSVKDIRDLAKALSQKFKGGITVDTLLNQAVTTANIRALKSKLNSLNVDDKVIFAFSGHGLLDKSFDYFLATYNTEFKNPATEGLAYKTLEWLLDSIPPRKKMILVDACHSGEVDKEDLVAIKTVLTEKNLKGAEVVYEYQPTAGMAGSFELMQELFSNLTNNTGTSSISAAAGTQFAYEQSTLRNGVFTFSLLELIQSKSHIKVSELRDLLSKRVSELTQGQQKPTTRSETLEFDWQVW